jgi:hypothetical protein
MSKKDMTKEIDKVLDKINRLDTYLTLGQKGRDKDDGPLKSIDKSTDKDKKKGFESLSSYYSTTGKEYGYKIISSKEVAKVIRLLGI